MGRVSAGGTTGAAGPRTLAEDLRRRTDDELLRLFALRSDLLDPIPPNLSGLAAAAASTSSVMAALSGLDRPSLAVLARLAASPRPLTLAALAEDCGVACDGQLAAVVDRLRDRALIWGQSPVQAGSILHPTVAVRELVRGMDRPGVIDLTPKSPEVRARRPVSGSGRASAVIVGVEALGAQCARRSPVLRKTGEYPTREATELAERFSVDPATVCFWVELARLAGLVEVVPDLRRQQPTPELLHWLGLELPERWACLVMAWLSPDRSGSGHDLDLTGTGRSADVGILRRLMLTAWAELGSGTVVGAEGFLEVARDRVPRREATNWPELIGDVLCGAEWLGLTVDGALTTAALPLAGFETEPPQIVARKLARAVSGAMPDPVAHMVLQADFTAVVPGTPTHALKVGLQRLGEVESASGAWVFRLRAESITAAVRGGWESSDILRFLEEHSESDVPQPIRYVVGDAQRRAREDGSTGVGQFDWGSVPPSRTEARLVPLCLWAEQGATRGVDLVHRVSHRVILRSLRAADARVRRATDGDGDIRGAAADFEHPRPRTATEMLSEIADAISADRSLLINYSDRAGTSDLYLIDPLRIGGGQLDAFDHGRGDIRSFVLSRLIGVRSADEPEAPMRDRGTVAAEAIDA